VVDPVKHMFWGVGLLLGLTISPALAQPDFLVEKVALAKEVDNRNPKGIFTPPAYCEKDKNGQAAIPVVQTSQTSQVVFWTKVEATTPRILDKDFRSEHPRETIFRLPHLEHEITASRLTHRRVDDRGCPFK